MNSLIHLGLFYIFSSAHLPLSTPPLLPFFPSPRLPFSPSSLLPSPLLIPPFCVCAQDKDLSCQHQFLFSHQPNDPNQIFCIFLISKHGGHVPQDVRLDKSLDKISVCSSCSEQGINTSNFQGTVYFNISFSYKQG